ncbi:DUF269 domain-containing protein [Paenibacillus sp. sgz500958]|uniref:DUF269 domain-containing protein n=1 Tax=Paenibacillus sp. sgz500958 TaxID=3242475 RepID=UPI0036D27C66
MVEENAALQGRMVQEGAAVKRRTRTSEREPEPDQELADAFVRRLCNLLDAEDFLGRYASLSPLEKIERLFLASPEDKNQSEFNCAVSPKVRGQVPMLFQAVAGVMEEVSGGLIQSTAEINSEGFGRALLYSGHVILVLKSLRAGFPFPFTSYDKAVRYGAACAQEGIAFLKKYREMTALHGYFSMEG